MFVDFTAISTIDNQTNLTMIDGILVKIGGVDMNRWQVQDAKAHLSELMEIAESEGPQVITRYGEDRSVLLSYEEFERITSGMQALKDVLVRGPKFGEFDIERIQDAPRVVDL